APGDRELRLEKVDVNLALDLAQRPGRLEDAVAHAVLLGIEEIALAGSLLLGLGPEPSTGVAELVGNGDVAPTIEVGDGLLTGLGGYVGARVLRARSCTLRDVLDDVGHPRVARVELGGILLAGKVVVAEADQRRQDAFETLVSRSR